MQSKDSPKVPVDNGTLSESSRSISSSAPDLGGKVTDDASNSISETRRSLSDEFAMERYRYILQQIHVVNENVYRFLAIYQGLMTALVSAQIVLFVNYKHWRVAVSTARLAVQAFFFLEAVVACFAIVLIVVGTLAWLDYRNEEVDLIDRFQPGLRGRPQIGNWYRWYETYVVLFILVSVVFVGILTYVFLSPAIR